MKKTFGMLFLSMFFFSQVTMTASMAADPSKCFARTKHVELEKPPQEKATDRFEPIFDGKTLAGWRCVPSANIRDWSVRNGKLVAKGSEDKLVYLVYAKNEKLASFELKLKYRMATKGNSGVEIRAKVDRTGKRPFEGYHADFGHVGIGPGVLGAWDFHFAKREEYPCPRGTNLVIDADGTTRTHKIKGALTADDINKHGWNALHIVADGNEMSFSVNGKESSKFTDHMPERLKWGMIGLQIHDAGMVVEFKDIQLKKITPHQSAVKSAK